MPLNSAVNNGDHDDDQERAMNERYRESVEHGGQVVARNPNGLNLYAATYEELYELLAAQGLKPEAVIFGFVERPDEAAIF